MMSELLSLPDEVLKLVMHHVPIVERLTSCCLVNRRLHEAAVAATSELRLSFGSSDDSIPAEAQDCALEWLSHYGQHVTSLHMYGLDQVLVQPLPCPNLQKLHMFECSVQLGPGANGTAGMIHGCTKLTCLELGSTRVDTRTPEGAVIASLSSLVHLQHLSVSPDYEVALLEGLSTATLPSLPQLTYLWVENLSVENLLQLGGLTDLQELCLTVETDMPVSPTTCPGLVLPASLTGLTLLLSVQGSILSLVPTGLQDLFMECDLQGPAEGPDSLLSCIARLQHLTQLKLNFVNPVVWPPAGPAYSALTASSRLARLVIHEANFPAGVWQHVFPASHKLMHLTYLSSGWKFPASLANLPSAWGAADLSSLVSCCPNLCAIVDILFQHGAHVSELHKLSALTHLELQFPASGVVSFMQSLSGVAAVTQLKALELGLTQRGLPLACFLPLTSLTALTKLVMWEGRYHGTSDHYQNLGTKDGSPPDVWLQLLEFCCADPAAQKQIVRSLAQQLAKKTSHTTQLRQQLTQQATSLTMKAERRQRLVELEQCVSAQQQQLATQQGELTVQRQVAAQQQRQIAELQGQLAAQAQVVQLLQGQVQMLRPALQ